MEIRAYDEVYLTQAQRILGDMMDFAVNSCDMDPDEYFRLFLVSSISTQFENGNPAYVSGKTGCEIVKEVIRESGCKEPEVEDVMYLDKSPEYWCGYALAYYQWYTARTFTSIHKAVSMRKIREMYPALHEADIMKFVDIMDERLDRYYVDTNLKRLRIQRGMSQRELAVSSGVSLRQIQLFEQKQRDINKTQAGNLFALSRILCCKMEELLEK